LSVPRVGIERPSVGEHNRGTPSPVLIVEPGPVFRGNGTHRAAPVWKCATSLSSTQVVRPQEIAQLFLNARCISVRTFPVRHGGACGDPGWDAHSHHTEGLGHSGLSAGTPEPDSDEAATHEGGLARHLR